MIELSQFDLLVMQAIIKSIIAADALDRKPNRSFTQAERIGNFTTFLRRETMGFVETYLCSAGQSKGMSTFDRSDLKRWLSRLTSTKYWVDVATPDYHGNRYYRSPFQLILSGTMTKIMDVERMKTLCDLAKEKVKVSSSSIKEQTEEISQDNFSDQLAAIIASANQKVAEVNLLSKQASSLLSNFSAPTT